MSQTPTWLLQSIRDYAHSDLKREEHGVDEVGNKEARLRLRGASQRRYLQLHSQKHLYSP